ncbi:MAG: hypothetical protein F6K61_14530 [Sphaerospermopsis sp. SIO1G1]|nr:hypothetical protein [Sphaerospermopsis sp. SIO1G1]
MKIVTDQLIEKATVEISNVIKHEDISYFHTLRTHWLLRPGTDDISGEKIINQLRTNLTNLYGVNNSHILNSIISKLENKYPLIVGYITSNLRYLG